MEPREASVPNWLNNKLGPTDELWSSFTVCSNITRDNLRAIYQCFKSLRTNVKVKLLLSFLHLPLRNLDEWRVDIEDIFDLACCDNDPWVSSTAELLKTLPVDGVINKSAVLESSAISEDDLHKDVHMAKEVLLPIEVCYLNKAVLSGTQRCQPDQPRHFKMVRKPKSAALRAELLQKSMDMQSSHKQPGSSSMPFKMRSFAKKLDDTTPMQGLPSEILPSSGGFRTDKFSHLQERPGVVSKKETKVKLLNFEDVPAIGKEAKRRRKQIEMEERKQKRAEALARQAELKADQAALSGQNQLMTVVVQPKAAPYYAAGLGEDSEYMDSAITVPTSVPFALKSESQPPRKLQVVVSTPGGVTVVPGAAGGRIPATVATAFQTADSVRLATGQVDSQSDAEDSEALEDDSDVIRLPKSNSLTLSVPFFSPKQQTTAPRAQQTPSANAGLTQISAQQQAKVIRVVAPAINPLLQRGSASYISRTPQNSATQAAAFPNSASNVPINRLPVAMPPTNSPANQPQLRQTNATPFNTPSTQALGQTPGSVPGVNMAQSAAPQERIGPHGERQLLVTKEQMLMAKRLFENANKLSLADKELIFGFIAGSRENPTPQLGPHRTIHLAENHRQIIRPSQQAQLCVVDSYVQLDYSTGQYKLFDKVREFVPHPMPGTRTFSYGSVPNVQTQQQHS